MDELIYDDSLEVQLNSLICTLDKNPKLLINPVEASSYLSFTFASSEEGFQQQIELYYDSFMVYLNSFVKACIHANAKQTLLLPTLGRLLTNYKHADYVFTHSELRLDWKAKSQYFTIYNPTNDYIINKNEKYTRWAYDFFFKASSIQLNFINKLIADITILLESNGLVTESVHDDDARTNAKTPNIARRKNNFFTILPSASKHSHDILQYIHKCLKEGGYINCTLPEFKQVFMSTTPKPIIWMKDYVHLTYLIKKMLEHFLAESPFYSNYEIATKYFYKKSSGIYFKPGKFRHDKGPKKVDKLFIDSVIRNSINHFLGINE